MDDRFTWQVGEFVLSNDVPTLNALNGRGYNPNRDKSTGRFTFGDGSSSDGYGREVKVGGLDIRYSDELEAYTRTPEFKSWFEGSRGTAMRTADEKPTLFFHRSDADFTSFKKLEEKPEYRDTGEEGFYFSDAPGDEFYGANEYAVFLKVKKIYRDSNFNSATIDTETVNDLKADGYDSIEGHGEIVVFEPSQIKIFSKNNRLSHEVEDAIDSASNALNGRGYNPNRDPKTGRFTWGDGSLRSDFAPKGELGDVTDESEAGLTHKDILEWKSTVFDYNNRGQYIAPDGDPYAVFDYSDADADEQARWVNEHIQRNQDPEVGADIGEYAGNRQYSAINYYLRDPKGVAESKGFTDEERQSLSALTERVKRSTRADTVAKDFSTYRAASFTEDYARNIRPGSYLDDGGIVSTSMDAVYAANFGARRTTSNNRRLEYDDGAEPYGNVVFRFNFKEGQKGVWSDPHRQGGGIEHEWIPQHGSVYQVTSNTILSDGSDRYVGALVDVDVYQGGLPKGYVQTKMFNSLVKNALTQEDEPGRFVWEEDDLEVWVPEEEANNARGYNPNRDGKTGQFTFGPKKQKATIAAREKDIRHNDYETFVAVDGSGKILLDKKGERSHVLIAKEEIQMLTEAKDVVFTHNHPSSASFSKNDLVMGSRIDAKEIRITSEKYEYSFKPGGPDNKFPSSLPSENGWADASQISQMYEYFNARAYDKYMPIFKSGKVSEEEVWLSHTDELMENLASELKSTYTRKELQ